MKEREQMIIKNTDELVKNAIAHKNADHIANNVYAQISGNHNGTKEEEWDICAIGCLATPATLKELVKEFPDDVTVWTEEKNGETYTFYNSNITDDVLLNNLKEKYGICNALARAAETFFEGTHNGAGDFDHYEDFDKDYTDGESGRHYILSRDERANFPLEFAQALSEGASIPSENVLRWFSENDLYLEINVSFHPEQKNAFLDWLRDQ